MTHNYTDAQIRRLTKVLVFIAGLLVLLVVYRLTLEFQDVIWPALTPRNNSMMIVSDDNHPGGRVLISSEHCRNTAKPASVQWVFINQGTGTRYAGTDLPVPVQGSVPQCYNDSNPFQVPFSIPTVVPPGSYIVENRIQYELNIYSQPVYIWQSEVFDITFENSD